MKPLSKKQREQLHGMFRGRCAYCGCMLGKNWHADHVKPVGRQSRWVLGKLVPTGILDHPERDCFENLFPACHRCNIDKSSLPLEHWRQELERSCEVLANNYGTYRHAVRFGLVIPRPAKVVFFFECNRRRILHPPLH